MKLEAEQLYSEAEDYENESENMYSNTELDWDSECCDSEEEMLNGKQYYSRLNSTNV